MELITHQVQGKKINYSAYAERLAKLTVAKDPHLSTFQKMFLKLEQDKLMLLTDIAWSLDLLTRRRRNGK